MNKHWQLRDEWYRIFHNWPALVAFFLLGGLLGWAAGLVWPSYSRANREIYVALNPYRAYSDTQFLALAKPRYSNIDNYHYWQMNQLSAAIFRSEVLHGTLERLRQADPSWNDVDADTLSSMLRTEWRTAGDWRLTAESSEPLRARQAVEAWSDQVMVSIPEAITAARQTFVIDQQLSEAGQALSAANTRQDRLAQAVTKLEDWRTAAAALPQDAPLSEEMRWQVYALTTAYALKNPAWEALIKNQPEPRATAAEYLDWTGQVRAEIQSELESLPGQISAQAAQVQELQTQYQAAADASLALSPNLAVENIGSAVVEQVRPTTTLALVGAFLGMLAWLMVQLIGVNRRLAEQAEPGSPPVELQTRIGTHDA